MPKTRRQRVCHNLCINYGELRHHTYRKTVFTFVYSVRGLERSELGGSHGIDFYDRSTRTIVGTML